MSTSAPVVVSCPGKVLVAGGYLVLDRNHQGYVISTPSRFYTVVEEVGTSGSSPSSSRDASESGDKIKVSVRSPQFDDGIWEYEATRQGEEWQVNQVDSQGYV